MVVFDNRRRSARHNVNFVGSIEYFKSGMRGIASSQCLLINLSLHGALLELMANLDVPDDFYLLLAREQRIVCAARHRSGRRLGVEFAVTLDQSTLQHVVSASGAVPTLL